MADFSLLISVLGIPQHDVYIAIYAKNSNMVSELAMTHAAF